MNSLRVFLYEQVGRQIRHPGFWVVAILAAIGARYLVPLPDANYVTLSVNDAYPIASAGVIGMQMGIVTALLLSPLAYIYLRAGPTRKQPWQVQNVTPASRIPHMLGAGLGDTCVLWLLMGILGFASIVLSLFRLPLDQVNPFVTLFTFLAIAAPALMVTAAIRTLFASRPMLRGAWGDVFYFIFWMAGNIIAITAFERPDATAFSDIFGFMAAILGSTDQDVFAATIGSSRGSGGYITLDAIKALSNPTFLISRLFWITVSIIVMVFAGLVFKGPSYKPKTRQKLLAKFFQWLNPLGQGLTGLISSVLSFSGPVYRSIPSLILQNPILVTLLVIISLAGFVMPLRQMIGPALMILLIFPLSRQSADWQGRHMRQFLETMPTNFKSQFGANLGASMMLIALLCLPSILKAVMDGHAFLLLPDFAFLILGLPALIMITGYLFRNATPGRLISLMLWYGYLNVA